MHAKNLPSPKFLWLFEPHGALVAGKEGKEDTTPSPKIL